MSLGRCCVPPPLGCSLHASEVRLKLLACSVSCSKAVLACVVPQQAAQLPTRSCDCANPLCTAACNVFLSCRPCAATSPLGSSPGHRGFLVAPSPFRQGSCLGGMIARNPVIFLGRWMRPASGASQFTTCPLLPPLGAACMAPKPKGQPAACITPALTCRAPCAALHPILCTAAYCLLRSEWGTRLLWHARCAPSLSCTALRGTTWEARAAVQRTGTHPPCSSGPLPRTQAQVHGHRGRLARLARVAWPCCRRQLAWHPSAPRLHPSSRRCSSRRLAQAARLQRQQEGEAPGAAERSGPALRCPRHLLLLRQPPAAPAVVQPGAAGRRAPVRPLQALQAGLLLPAAARRQQLRPEGCCDSSRMAARRERKGQMWKSPASPRPGMSSSPSCVRYPPHR